MGKHLIKFIRENNIKNLEGLQVDCFRFRRLALKHWRLLRQDKTTYFYLRKRTKNNTITKMKTQNLCYDFLQ